MSRDTSGLNHADLDNWITGRYGEDYFRENPDDRPADGDELHDLSQDHPDPPEEEPCE